MSIVISKIFLKGLKPASHVDFPSELIHAFINRFPKGLRVMAAATNTDIMLLLGNVQEAVAGVRRDMDAATESRKTLYEKNDDLGRNIDRLASAVEMQAVTTSQVRDALKELATNQQQMADNIRPILDLKSDLPDLVKSWHGAQKTGKQLVWLLSIGGASVVATAVWFGNLLTAAIQHWLGIVPPHL